MLRQGKRFLFFDRLLSAVLLCVVLFSFSPVNGQESGLLILSPAERAALRRHGPIRLAVDVDWAPFEFVDSEKFTVAWRLNTLRWLRRDLALRSTLIRNVRGLKWLRR